PGEDDQPELPGRYSRTPARAIGDRRLTDYDRRVLMAICVFVNKKTCKAWPGMGTIEKLTGIDRRDIPASLKRLEHFGYLRRFRRSKDGRATSNVYIVNFDNDNHGDGKSDAGDGVMSGNDRGVMSGNDTSDSAPVMPANDIVSSDDMTGCHA